MVSVNHFVYMIVWLKCLAFLWLEQRKRQTFRKVFALRAAPAGQGRSSRLPGFAAPGLPLAGAPLPSTRPARRRASAIAPFAGADAPPRRSLPRGAARRSSPRASAPRRSSRPPEPPRRLASPRAEEVADEETAPLVRDEDGRGPRAGLAALAPPAAGSSRRIV